MNKLTKYILTALVILILGQFLYISFAISSNSEIKLKYEKENQEREAEILLKATDSISSITKKLNDTISAIRARDLQIKFIPYEKRYYITRTPDSAVTAMRRAARKYNLQRENK